MWTKLSILVGLLAASLVMLEKQLPPPEDPTEVSQLSPHLREWHARGKMHAVHGHQATKSTIIVLLSVIHFIVLCHYLYEQMFAVVEGGDDKTEKETIVFVHGFPSSSYDYHRVFPLLKDKFKLVAFDQLGFGFSDKPNDV